MNPPYALQNVEEKITLAKELGLHECASRYAEIKEELESITKLKFPIVSDKQVTSMIEKRLFRFLYHENPKAVGEIILFFGGPISFAISITNFGVDNSQHCATYHSFLTPLMWTLGPVVFTSLICFLISSFPKCVREIQDLKYFDDILPRGALLAVKEATEAGLTDFKIHYPKLESRRVSSDPVITATKPGIRKMFMVHAWDDGKVYE